MTLIGQSPTILNFTEVGARTELWAASMLLRDISYLLPVLFHVAVLWITTTLRESLVVIGSIASNHSL